MFGVRILLFITAYVIVMLEVYSGAIQGPMWWILPGALVIALLISISLFAFAPAKSENGESAAGVFQWLILLVAALAIAGFSNYFGRELLPDLIAGQSAS